MYDSMPTHFQVTMQGIPVTLKPAAVQTLWSAPNRITLTWLMEG